MVVVAWQVRGPGRREWMEPAGLAAPVLGCPMLQFSGVGSFLTIIFGTLRAGPNPVAPLAMKPSCSDTTKPGRCWHWLLGVLCSSAPVCQQQWGRGLCHPLLGFSEAASCSLHLLCVYTLSGQNRACLGRSPLILRQLTMKSELPTASWWADKKCLDMAVICETHIWNSWYSTFYFLAVRHLLSIFTDPRRTEKSRLL